MKSLFLVISFQTPLKNPTRRAVGTKASGFVPPGYKKNCETHLALALDGGPEFTELREVDALVAVLILLVS